MSTLVLKYFYGPQAEQFSFYRVPRVLIKDKRFKGLSSDAKLLYGLMLDRLSLSQKNGWFDEENRAYIHYTIENIMEDLGCAKATCTKVMAELDSKKGIGLIEKKRQGLGKPDIIYVKNFIIEEQPEDTNNDEHDDKSTEVQNLNFKKDNNKDSGGSNYSLQEVQNADNQKIKNETSGRPKIIPVEAQKTALNYNNTNYTNLSNNQINQSFKTQDRINICNDTDMIDETTAYIEIIKENIDYNHHMLHDDYNDKQMFDELCGIICDVVCVKRNYIKINGENYPYELVKSKFLKLTDEHLEYVINCMKRTVTQITNVRSYMITALYNAPNTINHYYQQMVNFDLYGGGLTDEAAM